MKKFFTLLIVLVSVSGVFADELYLHNYHDSWTSYPSFTNEGVNGSGETVWTYVLNSTTGLGTDDFYFRLKYSDYSNDLRPYDGANYTYDFDEGKTWGQYFIDHQDNEHIFGSTGAFCIKHSKYKASEYKITILAKKGDQYYIRVDIVSMPVSVGAKGYATYCNADRALDFTDKNIKAYTVSSTNGSALTLTQVNKIAKNTPVLLYSTTESDSQNIPVITDEGTDDVTGNKLVAGNGSKYTWTAGTKYYILYTGGENPGFYKANNSTVAVGKAYLDLTGVNASRQFFSFTDDETTGIEAVDVNTENTNEIREYYNLNGQRVANPTKGLYIVNGKKVIIK